MTVAERALHALEQHPPDARIGILARHLAGRADAALAGLAAGTELAPDARRLDGSVLEAVVARALRGDRGAVFTPPPEAHLLAALGLARIAARRGIDEGTAVAALVGAARASGALGRALDGVRILDPCCGGGALLVAALRIARRCAFEPALLGRDVAPIAAAATAARLGLLDARADVVCGDAFAGPWPAADLVLSNPPFLRHEAIPASEKARASRASGLSRQADLSAHVAALSIRHALDVALVWPAALDGARSAAPLVEEARARGGFAWRLRSRVAGSFAASVDTWLAIWSLGHAGRAPVEAAVPLAELHPTEIAALARGAGGSRVGFAPAQAAAQRVGRDAVRVADAAHVRFGMKSGCNAFFHLRSLGGERFESALVGAIRLAPGDAAPLVASLRDAAAPESVTPSRHLFRPSCPGPLARAFVTAGEALGIHLRPTCRGRTPWWLVARGRSAAPVLYPAKIGARAFAVVNADGWCEDKKWHAIFPRDGLDPWLLATVLGATPIRLAIDRAARQLTGMQAIADVDCRVLAAAPFPSPRALAGARAALAACRVALARDPVTTDVAAMLARPAQEELDGAVGRLLGMTRGAVAEQRRELVARVDARLEHAASVRAAIARLAS